MANKPFITITNRDLYKEIVDGRKDIHKKLTNIELHLAQLNGNVANNIDKIIINRKMLYSIIGTMGTSFIFLIGVILNYHR